MDAGRATNWLIQSSDRTSTLEEHAQQCASQLCLNIQHNPGLLRIPWCSVANARTLVTMVTATSPHCGVTDTREVLKLPWCPWAVSLRCQHSICADSQYITWFACALALLLSSPLRATAPPYRAVGHCISAFADFPETPQDINRKSTKQGCIRHCLQVASIPLHVAPHLICCCWACVQHAFSYVRP